MRIRVSLFAAAAEAVGQRVVELELEDGATVAALAEHLADRFPRLSPLLGTLAFAVNDTYASAAQTLRPGDEVAVIPPVSGGAGAEAGPVALVTITDRPIEYDPLLSAVSHREAGAVLLFIGTVRRTTRGRRTEHLEYEAYAPMAEKEMAAIGEEIGRRWPGARMAIAHRTGRLELGEASVAIAVSAPHRADAYAASRYAIERLKQRVPIWKKEVWEDGAAEWVGPDAAALRYGEEVPAPFRAAAERTGGGGRGDGEAIDR